jgi:heme exporter protein A
VSATGSTLVTAAGLAISFRNAEKRFGSHVALRRMSLDISPGEFVALVGPNGSGKTTFLRMAAMLARPTRGTVEFPSNPKLTPSEIKLRIGLVGHFTMLYDELSAEENLRFFAELCGLDDPATRTVAALEPAGLKTRARDLVRTFSRGMRQRLAIARALLAAPSLLLLDEPAAGLDRDGLAWLAATVSALCKSGATVVMSSHEQSAALALATRAIAIREGALVDDSGPNGNVRAIIEREAAPIGNLWSDAQ